RNQFKENLFSIGFEHNPTNLNGNPPFEMVGTKENTFIVKINDGHKPNDVLTYFLQQQSGIVSFNEILPSLNDIFIKLVEGTPLTRQFQAITA
ncbi:MAG TPA: DUF4162 domain-containing protein, partial [Chitinophagaceae bacterium]|nr:DUF4162 domain-containing protein [Chitinophagaceae bacterium]